MAEFKKLTGWDVELCLSILGTFIVDIEQGWDIVLDALEECDYIKLRGQLHALGGSCASVFATELSESFFVAEKAVKDDNYNNEAFVLLLDKIDNIVTQQLPNEIEEYLSKK